MLEPLIQLTNITKQYKKKVAVNNVNLTFYRHQTTAILGANGAGKTTLVEMICRVIKPSCGEIKFFFPNKSSFGANVGVQFQTGTWPGGIRGSDVLRFFRGLYPSVRATHLEELIKTFQVGDLLKQNLANLSGGQQQRFNALLAVLHKPQLIIFDELTTGLDLELQFKILKYIQKLKESHQHTLILVSHSPEEIDLLADRLVLIKNGRIFADYLLPEVKSQFKTTRHLLERFFKNELFSNIKHA